MLWANAAIGQTWTPLTNPPPIPIGYIALATDGTVLAHAETFSGTDSQWYKLTPDIHGSYVNGTWSQIASMPSGYAPVDFGGGVLADGKLIVEGGEYNFGQDVETNRGAIYDPVADTWTAVSPPAGWAELGDTSGAILANGTYLMAEQAAFDSALFDEKNLSWTVTGTNKPDYNVEENWLLLPNKKVLNVETYWYDRYNATGTGSELYDPATGLWSNAGSTVVQLWDSAANCGGASKASYEVGPMVLRPDGTVFATGSNSCGAGHTAIYHVAKGIWTAGPDFPNGLNIADGPAAVETNGNVLMMASPGIYQSPTTFLEWNGSNLTVVPTPSTASNDSSFYGAMLVLPNGQILFSDISQNLQVWTPAGTYREDWRPTIHHVSDSLAAGGTYRISGTQFNGLTEGAGYGDDQQMATNYPLVRIVNAATGHVFYCRTHDHSTMGVATGKAIVSTYFDVPADIETGASKLYVVANGIPSRGVAITVDAAAPGYSLTATTATVAAGGTGTSTITQTAIGGFDSAVTLSVSGLPAGVTASFNPAAIIGKGTSTLTFTAASTVIAPGGSPKTYPVTLTGISAHGKEKCTTFYLTLVAAPAGSLSWNATSYNFGTLVSGPNSYTANVQFTLTNTGNVPVTINDVSVNSPGGEFVLNGGGCPGTTLAAGSQCVAYVYFSPSNQSPGTFTGSLVVTDSATNSPQTVALIGTGSASGFNISADNASVTAGSTGSATLTQITQGGFNAPVTLSADYVPAGVTVTFNPSTLTGAGTSTITYTASSTAAPGAYGVLLSGTSAASGETQVFTATLNVQASGSPSASHP
ncbi:hypothetical protein GCM10007901_25570 [Dyella acidisoli]|uniref:Choice-of-anchor D domain-containing protein n=2 Tax=Dyella acidisoli TaxID=1867834 RepID=A0ABQ5XSW5_9GAMM|nr:hypothetical protein GCM10007901_25570 [Dyella acidisoli]